jgi:hypothetical protein
VRFACGSVIIPGLLACAGAPPAVHPTAEFSWDVVAANLPEDPLRAAMQLEALRQERGLPIGFWADSAIDTVAFKLQDAPCGLMTTAEVRALPLDHRPLSADLAVEIDWTGLELRRWPIPVDANVEAIDDSVLLIPYAVDYSHPPVALLAVTPSGSFTAVPRRGDTPRVVRITCPFVTAFDGSDYLACWQYLDLRTNQVRLLAYQVPCT